MSRCWMALTRVGRCRCSCEGKHHGGGREEGSEPHPPAKRRGKQKEPLRRRRPGRLVQLEFDFRPREAS